MEYNRTPVPLLDPNKPLTDNGTPIGLTAIDYWRFQFSNIWDAQEEVAEYIVAKALGLELPHNKNGWTTCDIKYNGYRIEIKSSAYFHSWRGDGKISKPRNFDIGQTIGQHNETREEAIRQNDVYVFCLNLGESFEDSDPFEMRHWEFYVIPTSVINNLMKDKKRISLNRIRMITKLEHGITYSLLKTAVDSAIESLS